MNPDAVNVGCKRKGIKGKGLYRNRRLRVGFLDGIFQCAFGLIRDSPEPDDSICAESNDRDTDENFAECFHNQISEKRLAEIKTYLKSVRKRVPRALCGIIIMAPLEPSAISRITGFFSIRKVWTKPKS